MNESSFEAKEDYNITANQHMYVVSAHACVSGQVLSHRLV